jgi:hypothetical protein
MAFDVAGAKAAGYTDDEIAAYQAGQAGVGATLQPPLADQVPTPGKPTPQFDIDGARKAGYTDEEIHAYIAKQTPQPPAMVTGPDGQQYDASNADQLKHVGGMVGRVVTNAVAGLPMMAEDAGVSARNAITGDNYELPSQTLSKAEDYYFGTPQGPIEKATDFVGPMITGAAATRLPGAAATVLGGAAPEAGSSLGGLAGAPLNLPVQGANAAMMKAQRTAEQLRRVQADGFVVPPSTTNPTALNQAIETIGSKVGTQQKASIINQDAANNLAARANGIDVSQLSADNLKTLRLQAGKAYQEIKSAGKFSVDDTYKQQIQAVQDEAGGLVQSFPDATPSPALAQAKILNVGQMDSKHAVDMIGRLRDMKSAAYQNSDTQSGKMYGDLAKALEDQMDRALTAKSQIPGSGVTPDLVNNFRAARQKIAIAHSTEDAMDSAGNVSIRNLTGQMRRGEPLSGELQRIAQFGDMYEKASQPPAKIGSPGINHLEGGLSFLAAIEGGRLGHEYGGIPGAIGGVALGAGVPFARRGAQNFVLGARGQAKGIPDVLDQSALNDVGPTRAKAAALAQALSRFDASR